MLENIIFNEMIYNGFSVNVGTFDTVEKNQEGLSVRKTNEVDFFARKGVAQFYIQISADISSAKTRMREVKPYLMLNDQIQKIIVISKPIRECLDDHGFTLIGAADFLLRFIRKE